MPSPLQRITDEDRLRFEALFLKAAGVAYGLDEQDPEGDYSHFEAELRSAAAEMAPPFGGGA